jgi:hypothetical protein
VTKNYTKKKEMLQEMLPEMGFRQNKSGVFFLSLSFVPVLGKDVKGPLLF